MKEICIDATIENSRTVTEFVDTELEQLGCDLKAQCQIDVAIDEIFSNIAYYAYENGCGKAWVSLDYCQEDGQVKLTFSDQGKPYNPLEKKDPDTSLSAEERSIGGLGIFLVKKTMDSVEYSYRDGKNVLTIKKGI